MSTIDLTGMVSDEQHQALEEAVQWFVCLNDDPIDPSDQAAWRHWLDQSTLNRQAWQRVDQINQRFATLAQTQSGAGSLHVLQGAQERRISRRRMLGGLGALSALAVFGWGGGRAVGLIPSLSHEFADLNSNIGERRQFALGRTADLWLNTQSAVNYLSRPEQIELVEGEIKVRCQQPLNRPVLINAGSARIRMVSGSVCVRLIDQTQGVIALQEGAIELDLHGQTVTHLEPGTQVMFDAHGMTLPTVAEPYLFSWVEGLLQINSMSLSRFAAELSRYQHGAIAVEPKVAQLSVMGTFPTTDVTTALDMLETTLPVKVDRSIPWWTRIQAV
jgi:transmembrane sensor